MPTPAQLTIIDLRTVMRHRVSFQVVGLRGQNDIGTRYRICDLSSKGVLIDPAPLVTRGQRLVLLFPGIGALEAHCVWSAHEMAGFQFERPLRADELEIVSDNLQLNLPRQRR